MKLNKTGQRSILLLVAIGYFLWVFYYSFPIREGGMVIRGSGSVLVSSIVDSGRKQLSVWTPDDILIPRLISDDVPNFQEGFWNITRHNIRMLRDDISRMRTTDAIDEDLSKAFNLAAIDTESFAFPSSKLEYGAALDHLELYATRLGKGSENFYPRADNLVKTIEQYMSALGGICTRLNNASKFKTLMVETEGDTVLKEKNKKINVETPWMEVDDNFYYAQGMALALYWSMVGIKSDFKAVLLDKNSMELCDAILEILKMGQMPVIVVTNGCPHSLIPIANKSLQLSSFLQDARQKMHSLVDSLENG